ncbi:ATP-binding protein [Clostridium arbusti]|uniref:ATP-binding protein n=1 Tax=Clostridium arbusti TaxID=1137848 RepID=UPI000287F867|nr:sensor histidine kinase [Clostridium arbusti]
MKKNFYILLTLILLIPLAGEFKFFPFNDSFRVSLGTPIFFFFLLWARKTPLFLSMFLVGISVVIFRVFLDYNTLINFNISSSFIRNYSAFFYYFTYALLFHIFKVKKFQNRLFLIVCLSAFIEITSNILELSLRYFTLGDNINSLVIGEVIIIALIRSVFVLGIFSMLKLHEAEVEMKQKQNQNNHMLFLISGLYEESIELKKTLQDAENITRNCYNLYRSMQSEDFNLDKEDLSKNILVIAGEVHDIKKDNQRIYAGISKMISNENSTDYMNINEIGNIIVNSNKKYADSLGKKIKFNFKVDFSLPMLHVYTTLSLINNLVSNSVESIKEKGSIGIIICKDDEYIKFRVQDNGTGIPKKKKDLIFKPGYTTKYDNSGTPSTGMGLPYVKKSVESLMGSIEIESTSVITGTVFTIKLPIKSLTRSY